MAGFAESKAELDKLGISVVAASVDPLDKAKEVADEVNFPVAYEVSRDVADRIGAWWEVRRNIVQPSEFILDGDDKVVASSYSDGPLGRLDAADVVKLVSFHESHKK